MDLATAANIGDDPTQQPRRRILPARALWSRSRAMDGPSTTSTAGSRALIPGVVEGEAVETAIGGLDAL